MGEDKEDLSIPGAENESINTTVSTMKEVLKGQEENDYIDEDDVFIYKSNDKEKIKIDDIESDDGDDDNEEVKYEFRKSIKENSKSKKKKMKKTQIAKISDDDFEEIEETKKEIGIDEIMK